MTSAITTKPEITRDTAWRSGRLDARSGGARLLFGQVHEDSAIERAAFAKGTRVFCVASAGCTALALCEEHDVVACDINPAQIEYVRRRIEGGAREIGAAERVMGFMRPLMPLAGWNKRKLAAFLAMDDPEAQISYWHAELDTFLFRSGLALLLSPLSLRGAYSSALLSCLPPKFSVVLRRRMERCFARHPNRTNPYARALLLGSSEEEPTPSAKAASRIELVASDAATYLERCPSGAFGGFSLSNILDGAGEPYGERLLVAVRYAAAKGATVVRRSFSEPPPDLKTNRAEDDRSMLWGVVEVRAVEDL